MAKVGDIVRFLNSVGGGKIVRIEGNIAHVEDNDGFEVPALLRECVVVMTSENVPVEKPASPPVFGEKPAARASKDVTPSKSPELPPVEETPEGEKINVVLAFEADDLLRISQTEFEATLVNDSNFYLSFAFSTSEHEGEKMLLRKATVVEPNTMISLGHYDAASLNELTSVFFQYIAFKEEKPFEMKQPGSVLLKLDLTKFCRLHCFKDSIYFDRPVIEYSLVKDDEPVRKKTVDPRELENEIRRKKSDDRRPARRPIMKRHRAEKGKPIEVDLHIDQLFDTTAGMSRADMLNAQVDEFRRVMDANLRNHGQKIVFIHGKGEGVLRQALLKELNHRYKGHDVCDASFREYGFGATQVTIK